MSIHPRLCRSARLVLGWTQAELARRAEVSPTTVSHLEDGMSVQGRIGMRIREALAGGGLDFAERDGVATISFPLQAYEPRKHASSRRTKRRIEP
jgi:transcriptional regulator with XRE-family HTH domain